ncbi:hypothetical protein HMPREF0290_1108 [Corynebacterium efficiens YS-314]|nr:hypothetical protein HMPREF0290_1108 [Corynebacterium efficiens YS-314]
MTPGVRVLVILSGIPLKLVDDICYRPHSHGFTGRSTRDVPTIN